MNKLFLLGTFALAITAQAKVLTRPQLAASIRKANSVNSIIENIIDITKTRCVAQIDIEKNINETLASFSVQVIELNRQIEVVIAARAPQLNALTRLETTIAIKKSLIKTLTDRIETFGKDSERETSLKKELSDKTTLHEAQSKDRIARATAFATWLRQGNNHNILDKAIDKLSKTPPEALLNNEKEAWEKAESFNQKDNELSLSIKELALRLSDIGIELTNINEVDTRSIADLKNERNQAQDALKAARDNRKEILPVVADFNRKLRQLQARVGLATGFHSVVVNPDCVLLLQTS